MSNHKLSSSTEQEIYAAIQEYFEVIDMHRALSIIDQFTRVTHDGISLKIDRERGRIGIELIESH